MSRSALWESYFFSFLFFFLFWTDFWQFVLLFQLLHYSEDIQMSLGVGKIKINVAELHAGTQEKKKEIEVPFNIGLYLVQVAQLFMRPFLSEEIQNHQSEKEPRAQHFIILWCPLWMDMLILFGEFITLLLNISKSLKIAKCSLFVHYFSRSGDSGM